MVNLLVFGHNQTLRSLTEQPEQAKAILDSNLELLNSDFVSFIASKNNDKAVPSKSKENLQE